MAIRAAARRAAKEVVSMPKTLKTAMARAMLRATEMLARK